MANSATLATTSYQGRYLYVEWSAVQNVEGNYSTVTWTIKGGGDAQSSWYYCGPIKLWRVGVGYIYNSDARIAVYKGTVVASGSFKVSHSDDGTASIGFELNAAIYSTSINCKSGSKSWSLDTIPRATTPEIVYPSGNSCELGTAVTINTAPKSSSFTNTVTYTCGNTSGTIASGSTAVSITWTPPISLVSELTNLSGTVTITCTTYNGSTVIGTKTATINVTAPGATVPTVTYPSGDSVALGDPVTVNLPRKNSAYTHKLMYWADNTFVTVASSVGTSYQWVTPISYVNHITNGTSGTLTLLCDTYYESTKIGSDSVDITVTVPSTVPTVTYSSGSSVALGGTITINMPRKSDTFKHTLEYQIEDVTGVIGKDLDTSTTWTVPVQLKGKIDGTSGNVVIICKTYSDSTLIGTKTVSVWVTVPTNISDVDLDMGDFTLSTITINDNGALEISLINNGTLTSVDLGVFVHKGGDNGYAYVGMGTFEFNGLEASVKEYALLSEVKSLLTQSETKIKLVFVTTDYTEEDTRGIIDIGYFIGSF